MSSYGLGIMLEYRFLEHFDSMETTHRRIGIDVSLVCHYLESGLRVADEIKLHLVHVQNGND
jgi:hypothetical protein